MRKKLQTRSPRAIKSTGKVDVYGILFDIEKTAIKPASASTLGEVAKLMKNDPTLKLEVSGHTDNSGTHLRCHLNKLG
jgi:outer membrane protein OmpA-like peptidoglycan-associated protein